MSNIISNFSNDEAELPEHLLTAPLPELEDEDWLSVEFYSSSSGKPKNRLSLQRRQARGIALQTLFEVDSVKHEILEVLERHLQENQFVGETATFAHLLVEGVDSHRDELDALISSSAPTWPIEQMAKVDKNILRLAIFEILFNNEVPTKAAINEAIELAKSFGSNSSSRFVNGVLGAIVSQQDKTSEKS